MRTPRSQIFGCDLVSSGARDALHELIADDQLPAFLGGACRCEGGCVPVPTALRTRGRWAVAATYEEQDDGSSVAGDLAQPSKSPPPTPPPPPPAVDDGSGAAAAGAAAAAAGAAACSSDPSAFEEAGLEGGEGLLLSAVVVETCVAARAD